jgi:rubrerythrin
MGTLDSTETLILDKLRTLNRAALLLDTMDTDHDHDSDDSVQFIELENSSPLTRAIEEITSQYHFNTANVIHKYRNTKDPPTLLLLQQEYLSRIASCGILIHLDKLSSDIRSKYQKLVIQLKTSKNTKHKKILEEVYEILDKDHKVILKKPKKLKEEATICTTCNVPMVLILNISKNVCPECRAVKNVYDIVPQDVFLDHTTTAYKPSNYRQDDNCEIALDKIQGLESKEIPDALLKKLRRKANRESFNIKRITCRKIREWLKSKEINATEYNSHVPKIKFHLTGIAPERLTYEESQTVKLYLRPTMVKYNEVKGPTKKNSLGQQYIVLKIMEQVIDRDSKEKEKRFLRIVSNIHFQGKNTILKNDAIMRQIKIGPMGRMKTGIAFDNTDYLYYLNNMDSIDDMDNTD